MGAIVSLGEIASLAEPAPGPCKHANARIVNDHDEAWCPECGSVGMADTGTWIAPNIVAQLATLRDVAGFLSGQLQATKTALLLAEARLAAREPKP